MVRKTNLDLIRERLELLPMAQRAVFLLCRIDGFDFAEVAWRLGIDTGTVERHLAYALRVLTFGPREGDEQRE